MEWGKAPQGRDKTKREFQEGRCHDFAQGLGRFLTKKGIPCEAVVLCSQYCGQGSTSPPFYNHTALRVGNHFVDINGVQTPAAFEKNWSPDSPNTRMTAMACAPEDIASCIRDIERNAGVLRCEGASIHVRVAQRVDKAFQLIEQGRPVSFNPTKRVIHGRT